MATTIVTTTALDNQCNFTVTDNTGFYNSISNPTGFLPEADSSSLALNLYKISNGYFFNVLLLNKYSTSPIIINTTETLVNIPTGSVNTTYSANFTTSSYPLTYDGTYTMYRFFIPTLTFYTANHANSIYTGITQYYSDGTNIYLVVSGTPTIITPLAFATTVLTSSNVLVNSTQFISTCNMNNCYFRLLSTILDYNIGKRHYREEHNNEYRQDYGDSYLDSTRYSKSEDDKRYVIKDLMLKRDILYMTLETIKYLIGVNNITQIEKLIESIDVCGTLCGNVLNQNYGCGCS